MSENVAIPAGLHAIASRFAIATPEMLGERQLLRRVDTKFLLPSHALIWVLANIAGEYQMLRSNGQALARYRTTYLDTPDLRCYHDHRRGRLPRHKVRLRDYLDRQVSFFEIKTKRASGETQKHRLKLAGLDAPLPEHEARRLVGLHTPLPFDELTPSIVVDFSRITLLAIRDEERVTIDVGLGFRDARPGFDLSDIAIVEVKQPSLRRQTPIMQALHTHGFYARAGSKYCTTLVLARPSIPANHIRPALRAMERLQA
jgi:hypothetical protein